MELPYIWDMEYVRPQIPHIGGDSICIVKKSFGWNLSLKSCMGKTFVVWQMPAHLNWSDLGEWKY